MDDTNGDIKDIFNFWKLKTARSESILTAHRKSIIRKALGWGFSKSGLKKSICGCLKTPFYCGENDSGETYNDLKHIFASVERVEQFILNFKSPPKGMSCIDDWQESMLQESKK